MPSRGLTGESAGSHQDTELFVRATPSGYVLLLGSMGLGSQGDQPLGNRIPEREILGFGLNLKMTGIWADRGDHTSRVL